MPEIAQLAGLHDARPIAAPGLDRQEWLRLRRRGIGGSDIAAICGLNTYTSPYRVYLDKRGEIPFEPDSEAAKWGRRLEPVVAAGWAEDTGIALHPCPGMLSRRDRPWMLANPDYLAGDPDRPAILEIKTRSVWQLEEWESGVPDGPALQVQWYMAVTGAVESFVAALIGGNTLRWHHLVRDQALIETLIAIAARFRDDVAAGRAPVPDGSHATTHLLAYMAHPYAGREHHADAAEVQPLLDRRAELKAAGDPGDALQIAELENGLIAELKGADTCVVNGRIAYTWRATRRFAAARFRTAPTTPTCTRGFKGPPPSSPSTPSMPLGPISSSPTASASSRFRPH